MTAFQLTPPKYQDNDAIALSILENTKLGEETVSSLSGGKTSSYMALKFPTKHYIFAVVLTDDPRCQIKDKGLLAAIQAKCPCFKGSRELDQTLINILRLEQELGSPIQWVWGNTYDQVVAFKKGLPNKFVRYCTTELKIKPIFTWCYNNLLLPKFSITGEIKEVSPIQMNIGFRKDESSRVYKMLGAKLRNKEWDWSQAGGCEPTNFFSNRCDIAGKFKGEHRHIKSLEWRFKQAPLWEHGIKNHEIRTFWEQKGWVFPDVSNCDFCFFHTRNEHLKQFSQHPERAEWWIEAEKFTGHTFLKNTPIEEILDTENTLSFEYENEYENLHCACTD
jgi:hypothetical protein